MYLEPIIQSEASQKENNKYHILMHIWNLERWYWWTYLQGRNGDTDVEDSLVDTVGEGGWDELRKQHWLYMYASMCKINSPRTQPDALWWPQRVGLGEGGREAQEGRDICILMFKAERWKQPEYQLMDEWINKMWYIQT